MNIKIGKFDATTRTIPVTFSVAGVTHERAVNAVLTKDGAYDEAATKERVDAVALGVEHKIRLGVITNPPPPPPPVGKTTVIIRKRAKA